MTEEGRAPEPDAGPSGGGSQRRGPLGALWYWIDNKLESSLCFLFYAYLTAIIIIEVVRRYVFESSTTYAEETARYAFIWLTYIACARGVRKRGHLSIDIFSAQFGRSGKFAVFMLSDVCFLILSGVIVFTSIEMVRNNIQFYQTFSGLDAPMWLATVAVPAGWTLIGLRVIQRNLETIRAYLQGRPIEPGLFLSE